MIKSTILWDLWFKFIINIDIFTLNTFNSFIRSNIFSAVYVWEMLKMINDTDAHDAKCIDLYRLELMALYGALLWLAVFSKTATATSIAKGYRTILRSVLAGTSSNQWREPTP